MVRPRNRFQPLSVAEAWDFLNRLEPGDNIHFAAGQTVDYTTEGEPCRVTEVIRRERADRTKITVRVRTHGGAHYELEASDTDDRTWAYRIDGGNNRNLAGELVTLSLATLRYSVQ